MPQIIIDNRTYQVAEGQNLLHAALSHGLDVPYFCWHPKLGSVGACRQCAVQHLKDPSDTVGRTVMACMTPASEGSCFSVDHPTAVAFRKNVIEWMMTNHPHDCPVCDEGGECHLQDMTMMTEHNYRRYRFQKRTFKNQDLGPFVRHEMNRCITCYRCVRFYRDHAGGDDLSNYASSNRVYFGRAEDGTLESEFSGNLVEVCPTGVFTDKPFSKFFNRKWDLQQAPSVCQLCSVGCSITPGERFRNIRRVVNRYNPEINGYFLCDKGRFGHSYVNDASRLTEAMCVDGADAKMLLPEEADAKFHQLVRTAKSVVGIGSPRASLEANFALRELVGEANFYAGVASQEWACTKAAHDIATKSPVPAATIYDIEMSDAVLILGEDLTNTAARMALAVRQVPNHLAAKQAAKIGIPDWNDAAIRNLVREKKGPIFVCTPASTKLDDIAQVSVRAHAQELTQLANAIAHKIDDSAPNAQHLAPELDAVAGKIAEQLLAASKPVVLSGSSSHDAELMKAASNISLALQRKAKKVAHAFVLPEANSMGLAMLASKGLHELAVQSDAIDVLVIVENDVVRRLGVQATEALMKRAGTVVCMDSFTHATTRHAHIVLPTTSFAQESGTLVNYEGRAQRYWRVFEPKGGMRESWRWLRGGHYENLDAINARMAQVLPAIKPFVDHVPKADFRVNGQKLPRGSQKLSGRTAMLADVTMHEPKPANDVDSPFSQSMEGYTGPVPAEITPFVWQPGWDSNQAVVKYQEDAGGVLKGGSIGTRLFHNASHKGEYYAAAAAKSEKGLRVSPMAHLFGSEERASMSLALSQRIEKPYVAISEKDAQRLGLVDGQSATVEGSFGATTLFTRVCSDIDAGTVGLPVGLPGMPFGELPTHVTLHPAIGGAA